MHEGELCSFARPGSVAWLWGLQALNLCMCTFFVLFFWIDRARSIQPGSSEGYGEPEMIPLASLGMLMLLMVTMYRMFNVFNCPDNYLPNRCALSSPIASALEYGCVDCQKHLTACS